MHQPIVVLLNPAAGAAARPALQAEIVAAFAAADLPAHVRPVTSAAQAHAAARDAIASGADVVVAAGGDGTVGTIAAALVETRAALGILPLGTLNHFAKDLHVPLELDAAVRTLAARHTAAVDVGDVNGHTFVNNSSIGVYPNIVVEREALRAQGYRKWTAFVLASAKVLSRYRGVVVRITAGGEAQAFRTPFLFVGNNEYLVDGIRMGARARLDGGLLYGYYAPRLHARQLPGLAALALAGRARDRDVLESFAAERFDVETLTGRPLRVALDGEVLLMAPPLHYRIRPRCLRVVVAGG